MGFLLSLTALLNRLIPCMKLGMGRDGKEKLNLEAQGGHLYNTLLLFQIIFRAGKALDSYIQTHKEVPKTKLLQRISQILNDHGFSPSGGVILIGDLSPYEWWPVPNGEKIVETKADAETPNADKKSARKRLCRSWELECTCNSYFPYWRSVLALRSPIKVYPVHAQTDKLRPPKFD